MNIFETRYDCVMSFGHDCGCASYLNKFGLRSVSGPFDWVGTGEGVRKNVDLLLTDFEGVFELDGLTLTTIPEAVRETGTKRYVLNEKHHIISGHDFPRALSLEAAVADVRERYARRSRRMREILSMPMKKLLIGWNWRAPDQSDEDILAAANRLRESFPAGMLNLVYMQNVKGAEGLDEKELAPGVVRYRGWFYKPQINETLGDIELNSRVFSRIRAKGRWKNLLRLTIDKYRRRLKTQLHFSAAARREARKAYKKKVWEF